LRSNKKYPFKKAMKFAEIYGSIEIGLRVWSYSGFSFFGVILNQSAKTN
jgi:hypothetical protein